MSAMSPAKHRPAARVAAALGLLVMAFAALLGPAAPASAHAVLVSSSPPNGAVLASAPSQVVLTFSEGVRAVPDRVRVIGPDGSRVDRGKPAVSGAVLTITVDQGAPRGTYLVTYRIISADSHPVVGGYTYSVGAASTPPTDTGGGSRVDPVVSTAVKIAKYVGYAGLALLVGPVLVLALLWPRRLSRRGPTRLAYTGAGLVALSTLAGLWLQLPYTGGGGLFAVSGAALTDVLGSTFGAALLVRLGLLGAAVILLRPVLAGTAGRTDGLLLLVLGGCGLATWSLAGHPAATPVPVVSVVADMAHLAAMAVWLGGLVMLAGFLLPRASARELVAILPIWSRWAAVAVTALVVAGTVQALIEVGTPAALVDTGYGQLLLAKIALFALVIGVAAVSRQHVRRHALAGAQAEPDPDAGGELESGTGRELESGTGRELGPGAGGGRGESDPDAAPAADLTGDAAEPEALVGAVGAGRPRGLRRLVVLEMAVLAVVLALSAVLVQQPPARNAAGTTGTAGTAAPAFWSATLTSSLYSLQVEVDPAQTGNNSLHLYAYTPDNRPQRVVEWKATAARPDQGVEPITIPLLPIGDNHATGEISLPTAGPWQLRFTLRTTDIDQATVTATVPVK
ncbi:copper resistance CopC/CopD family protein [Plantactinospora siamensis]|uniref:Copper resistance CopC/CopD family protein n=1 Tax=Plantactinospora siamensis TaxID=555372 RepID=A0ABV6NTS2_9ACTN